RQARRARRVRRGGRRGHPGGLRGQHPDDPARRAGGGALTGGCVRAVNLLCLAPLEPRLMRWAPFSNRPRGGALMRLMLLAIVLLLLAPPAFAQIAVSVDDNKAMLDNGTVKVVPNRPRSRRCAMHL